jgi:hypothetical protein
MSGRALSEEAMLASLQGLDLPAEAADAMAADLAVAVGLGALAALAVAVLLRLVSQRGRPVPAPSLRQLVDAARALPEAERRLRLLHLLRARAPDRYRALAHDLYRPDSDLTAERLERELAALA